MIALYFVFSEANFTEVSLNVIFIVSSESTELLKAESSSGHNVSSHRQEIQS